MAEPTLVTVVVQAAAKAAAGKAVTSSVPMVQRFLQQLRRDPSVLRRFESWRELKLNDRQQHKLREFLESDECGGILELVAFLSLDRSSHWLEERESLKGCFAAELRGRLTLADAVSDALIADLWGLACAAVQLEIDNVRTASGFSDVSTIYARNAAVNHLYKGKKEAFREAIQLRSNASESVERAMSARSIKTAIESAALETYSEIKMPHAREVVPTSLSDMYVHRQLTRIGLGYKVDDSSFPETSILRDGQLHQRDRRFVVLGNPGAGKTTYVRYLLHKVADARSNRSSRAPILIELKNFSRSGGDFIDAMASSLRALLHMEVSEDAVRDILALGYASVVFDGLDEISHVTERRAAVERIDSFCRRFPLVQVIVTARREGYDAAPLSPKIFTRYYLPDFTNPQMLEYVTRWFSLADSDGEKSSRTSLVPAFLADSEHVEDLRSNPLMLSLLCLLYVYEGWIPANRLEVYEECTGLLFERWDRIKRVENRARGRRQIWFGFQELAHAYFVGNWHNDGATESQILSVLKRFFAGRYAHLSSPTLAAEARDFLEFSAGRAWLLTRGGANARGERLYEFSHRTFMEYFAACYIARHCKGSQQLARTVYKMVEEGKSYVVGQMALQEFDIRNADGLDEALNALLDKKSTFTEQHYLFLIDMLHYVQPGPSVSHRILTCSVIYATQWRSDAVARSLTALPRGVRDDLQSYCRELADGDSRPGVSAAAAVGLILVRAVDALSLNRDSTFYGVGGTLPDSLAPQLKKLGMTYPDLVYRLLQDGLISIEMFLDALGPAALMSVPGRSKSDKPVAGPLLHDLSKFASADGSLAGQDRLLRLLEIVAVEPNSVLPIEKSILTEIHRVLTGLNVPMVANALGINRAASGSTGGRSGLSQLCTVGFVTLWLAIMCAYFEREGPASNQIEFLLACRLITRTESEWVSDHTQFGAMMARAAKRGNVRARWVSAFSEWATGGRSFCNSS